MSRGEGYISCKTNYFPFCGPDNQVTAMREPLPVLAFASIALVTNESLLAAAALRAALHFLVIVVLQGRLGEPAIPFYSARREGV